MITQTRLAEQGTHDRSIPEDAGLKLIELKVGLHVCFAYVGASLMPLYLSQRKVSRLEDRIKRDAEIKQHLKSICASLKDEVTVLLISFSILHSRSVIQLFVANQKMEYMHAELQV